MQIHVISFNIPYPPIYGGVIDVYYKIKALYDLGVEINLHCFEYGREESQELKKICNNVFYYHREHSYLDFTSKTPYIVKTRKNVSLLDNLLKDDSPILFEGLHTCYYLAEDKLKSRLKIVRMHNVESDYYRALGGGERNIMRKFYFYTESIKLKNFEKILNRADLILPISIADYDQLKIKYQHVEFLPAFHPNENVVSLLGKGDYALFHGNLSVNENNQAAVWLVAKVFKGLKEKLIIAGSNPSPTLLKIAAAFPNVEVIANPNLEKMNQLVRDAHIHVLPTFQATGIKLKLLNALFNGRFVLVNPPMVENTGLERLCTIAETAEEMKGMVKILMKNNFGEKDKEMREELLLASYSNVYNGEKLVGLIDDKTTEIN